MRKIIFLLAVLMTGLQVNATSMQPVYIGEPMSSATWYSFRHNYLIINPPFDGQFQYCTKDSNAVTGQVHTSDTVTVSGKGMVSVRVSGLAPETNYMTTGFFIQDDSVITETFGVNKTYPVPSTPNYFVREEAYLGISDLAIEISSSYPVLVYALYGENYSVETIQKIHAGGVDTVILPMVTPSYGEYPYVVILQYSDSTQGGSGIATHHGVLKVIQPEPIGAPEIKISNEKADCGELSFTTQVTPKSGDTASVWMYMALQQDEIWYLIDSTIGINRKVSLFTKTAPGLSADTEYLIKVVGISKDGVRAEKISSVRMPEGWKPTLNVTPKIVQKTVEFNTAGFMGCDGGFFRLVLSGPTSVDTSVFTGAQSYEGAIKLNVTVGSYFWEACVENQYGQVCKTGEFEIQGTVTSISEAELDLRETILPSAQVFIYDTLGRQVGQTLWGDVKFDSQNPLLLFGTYVLIVPSVNYSEPRVFTR